MIGALKYFFAEALLSLWRGRRAGILSILTIAAGLFVLGVFLVLTANLQQWIERWGSAAEFSIYLQDTVTDAQRESVVRTATSTAGVAGAEFVSKAEAMRRFTRDFPDLAAAALGSAGNPFPASLEVRLSSPGTGTDAVERLAQSVGRLPGVAEVRYDRRWLDRLASVASAVRWAGFGLSAVLILAAVLTITSVVRLALVARRDEIEIMELVGAPVAFIRGPFIFEGILQGAIGAALALTALYAAFAASRGSLDAVVRLGGAGAAAFLSVPTVLWVLGGGALVGCVGGFAAVRRFH